MGSSPYSGGKARTVSGGTRRRQGQGIEGKPICTEMVSGGEERSYAQGELKITEF